MASPQQPLTANHDLPSPRITVRLTPHACQKQRKDSQHITALVKSTDPGHGLKCHIEPLVTSQPLDIIAEKVALAAKLDPTYEPVDFSQWYKIEFDPAECKLMEDNKSDGPGALEMLQQHAQSLFNHDEVESAHVEGACCPAPVVNWQDDPRSANQGYLDPAPKGVDVKYAWSFPGGDGAGTNVVDVERGWNLDHEDLVAAAITLVPQGRGAIREEDKSHGTAVLGQILMVDNKIGGIGIAPKAKGRVISSWRQSGNNPWFMVDMVNALLDATTVLESGDVVLIEAQERDPTQPIPTNPVGQRGLLPVEVLDTTFAAIRTLTALGITVVEAGCNGEVDLDAYVHIDGKKIFNRSAPGFRDSGAILVGAADSTTRKRSWFSNYGSRIDVFAWGDNIDTAYYQTANATSNNLYTTTFGGTSGASPIITGATLILQGLAVASKFQKLKPPQIRQILTVGATPSQNPASDRIGVMPNLKAIIDGNSIGKAQAAAK